MQLLLTHRPEHPASGSPDQLASGWLGLQPAFLCEPSQDQGAWIRDPGSAEVTPAPRPVWRTEGDRQLDGPEEAALSSHRDWGALGRVPHACTLCSRQLETLSDF